MSIEKSKIPAIHEMVKNKLERAKSHINELRQAQSTPHLLDNKNLVTIIGAYTELQQVLPIHLTLCKQWQREKLEQHQLVLVKKIEGDLDSLYKSITKILALAKGLEKILSIKSYKKTMPS